MLTTHRKTTKSQSLIFTRFISHSVKSDTCGMALIYLVSMKSGTCGLQDWLQQKTGRKKHTGSKLSQSRTDTRYFCKQFTGQNQLYGPHLAARKVVKGRARMEYLVSLLHCPPLSQLELTLKADSHTVKLSHITWLPPKPNYKLSISICRGLLPSLSLSLSQELSVVFLNFKHCQSLRSDSIA